MTDSHIGRCGTRYEGEAYLLKRRSIIDQMGWLFSPFYCARPKSPKFYIKFSGCQTRIDFAAEMLDLAGFLHGLESELSEVGS